MLQRRQFLVGLFAPAIVSATNLMPIKAFASGVDVPIFNADLVERTINTFIQWKVIAIDENLNIIDLTTPEKSLTDAIKVLKNEDVENAVQKGHELKFVNNRRDLMKGLIT